MAGVDPLRIETLNQARVAPKRRFVLYWMTAARRTGYNFGLQRAVGWARELNRPLVILEALRVDYPWASRRLHAFILQGMTANQRALAGRPVTYHPFVETRPGQGRGLLAALAGQACCVVADQFPCFFIPRMLAAAASKIDVLMEAVDSCGLVALARPGREFARAYDFRRFLQRGLAEELAAWPQEDPLKTLPQGKPVGLPEEVLKRWPPAPSSLLRAEPGALSALPIDQEVGEVARQGGQEAAKKTLKAFLETGLERYADQARHPGAGAVSNLSPFLHFGHISAHQVFLTLADREDWSPSRPPQNPRGAKDGWLGLSPSAEAFLDQLLTWRELGYNFCRFRSDYDRYSALPSWARQTLEEHLADKREYIYSPAELERAQTHDRLWNAAQGQLLREGVIHNYLRMVWGKKILEWTEGPGQALRIMIELNNRHALDGRDPNSYSGIFWVLGRFDRAWGPERPIYGKIRYMSSENTLRKLRLGDYLDRYAPE